MRNRLPAWLNQEVPGKEVLQYSATLRESGVHTVCQEAKCPNLSHCFQNKRVTFMILGDTCTRNCSFCNVKKSGTVLKPSSEPSLFVDEARKISRLVENFGLNYAVITSVTRDDLSDGGAAIFARTIRSIHSLRRNIKVEALIPDFQGSKSSLKYVLDADPAVVAHNIETVKRLYPELRAMADYQKSLEVLSAVKEFKPEVTTKSSLMLGLGETRAEVIEAMEDLRRYQCDIVTLGQYLAPTAQHYPVKEFVTPGQFQRYHAIGMRMGFGAVFSGPKVRSSYHAKEVYDECLHA